MKAAILIGGQGTRLRPFTLESPKPLLPVLNRPFLEYQFQVLRTHGVREAVLCVSYLATAFRRAFGDGRRLGLRLRYVSEPMPLGTGGAVKNAEPLLRDGPALILNGDVLNAFDLREFLRFHRARRAELSIALSRVKDPTQYGLVLTDEKGYVKRFLEKPSWDEVESNTINAGAYLFEPPVFGHIPAGKTYSLERGLFPERLAAGAKLGGWVAPGYWIDIGTVEKYLQVHLDVLEGRTPFKPGDGARPLKGAVGARVAAGPGTKVAPFARFSGAVSLGRGVRVGRGAQLSDCVVLDGAAIGDGARLERCVVGARAKIGTHAVLGPGTALAGGSRVGDYSQL
ncbi:MAG: NDP-sugar synthase [Elusimicrobia bacterium]|nr:NDP-sugar synthase [Elusimicrobiota bacterium]